MLVMLEWGWLRRLLRYWPFEHRNCPRAEHCPGAPDSDPGQALANPFKCRFGDRRPTVICLTEAAPMRPCPTAGGIKLAKSCQGLASFRLSDMRTRYLTFWLALGFFTLEPGT